MAYVPDPSHPNESQWPHYADTHPHAPVAAYTAHRHQVVNEKVSDHQLEHGQDGSRGSDDVRSDEEKEMAELARQKTIENEITFGFIMTMVGFSITFVVAEVIPLFLITLFTVIAYDLAQGAHVIWGLVAQIIAVGAIVPFVGTLADLLGRKGITLVSLGFTIIGMICIGTTPNLAGFIAGQAVSGIGIGIQLLTAIAAVTELVPTHKRGITIGYIVCGFLPFAPASIYGQLLAQYTWRYVTAIIGGFAVLAFVILAIWYKPPPRVNAAGLTRRELIGRIDFVGAVLSIAGVVTFLIGLNWGGQDYPWSNWRVILTLTLGLVLLLAFGLWEKFGTKYPLFPSRLIGNNKGDKKMFFSICFLCLASGINYIPVVVFWVVQCYTVYENNFEQAGVHLLPIGFCIAGGAIISAAMMTIFSKHIHWVLTFFCVVQTAGLGCMAAISPDNINTAWGPMIVGLIGVGGVLLPSQVVFSIISPEDLIGTSVALSIVIRSVGQVIGVSMFYNIFFTTTQNNALADLSLVSIPAISNGVFVLGANGQPDLAGTVDRITFLVTTLTAGPLSYYAPIYFPELNTPAKIQAIQTAGHNLYMLSFPKMYLVSIAWGGAAIIVSFFLRDIKKYMNENVAVHLG